MTNSLPLSVQKDVYGFICASCGGAMGVTDSRPTHEGFIRRRRVCRACGYRESTIELPIKSYRPAQIRSLRNELKQAVKQLMDKCDALSDAFDGR